MRLRRLLAVVAAVVVAFALGYATRRGGERPPPPVASGPPVLTDAVRQVLAERYVSPLDPDALAGARTVPQLMKQLGDPFSSYLTSAEYAALKADSEQGFWGVGVRVRVLGSALQIVGVVPKSPAARAGLRKGDALLAVDGTRVHGHLDTALGALQARHLGPLALVTRRGSGRAHVVLVSRGVVPQPAVLVNDLYKGTVRVIHILRFSRGVAAAVRRAARDAPIVVLDLRGNPGGLIGEATKTVDVFLDRGRIYSFSGAHMLGGTVTARRTALPHMPLVVVVDRATASAAEIVAAALSENKRAKVVGTRTFGKASIQAVVAVPGGGAVKLTVATYRTPNGLDIHGKGIRPDVPVRTQLLVHAVAVARKL
jgi:carboxyl-terminal processing protease